MNSSILFIFNLINHYGYFIIGLFILLECLGIPLPGETSLAFGAVYASLYPNKLNIFLVILTAVISGSLGDNLGYLIGEKYGISFIKFLSKILKTNIKYVDYTKKFFDKYGFKTVFIGRFLSVLRMFIPITAGIHKIEYKKFFIYNISGSIVWASLYGTLGFILGRNLQLLESVLKNITYSSIILIIIATLYIIYKRYEKQRIAKFR